MQGAHCAAHVAPAGMGEDREVGIEHKKWVAHSMMTHEELAERRRVADDDSSPVA